MQRGQVRVGTCSWVKGKRVDPSFPRFTPIVCLTPSTDYGDISPYTLKALVKFSGNVYGTTAHEIDTVEEHECLVENVWQFSKVYPYVSDTTQTKSRFDRTVIWSWPTQVHYDAQTASLTREYLQWRKAGMTAEYPIRYPVGQSNMKNCVFALEQDSNGTIAPQPLNYVDSRKVIYLPLYVGALKRHPTFHSLKERLNRGENLLIIEVDGPRSRSLDYYIQTYGVDQDFIENDTILVTEPRLNILINDSKERFGHGYCLAGALLDIY